MIQPSAQDQGNTNALFIHSWLTLTGLNLSKKHFFVCIEGEGVYNVCTIAFLNLNAAIAFHNPVLFLGSYGYSIIGYLHPNNPLAKIKSGLVVIVLLGSALVAIVSNSAMVTLAILGLNYGMQTSWIQNVFDNLVMPSPRKCLPKTSFN